MNQINSNKILYKLCLWYNKTSSFSECVGSVGLNCSLPCPPEYFGPKCASHCQCTKDECDAKFGCPKGKIILGFALNK